MSTISFSCPASSANVPAAFSVQGSYSADGAPSVQVKCKVVYYDTNLAVASQCKVCVLGADGSSWCCKFDLSGDLPSGGGTLVLGCRLYDGSGNPLTSPATETVTYQANQTDPCSCSGAGNPC